MPPGIRIRHTPVRIDRLSSGCADDGRRRPEAVANGVLAVVVVKYAHMQTLGKAMPSRPGRSSKARYLYLAAVMNSLKDSHQTTTAE